MKDCGVCHNVGDVIMGEILPVFWANLWHSVQKHHVNRLLVVLFRFQIIPLIREEFRHIQPHECSM